MQQVLNLKYRWEDEEERELAYVLEQYHITEADWQRALAEVYEDIINKGATW